jgi:hypothetical protein
MNESVVPIKAVSLNRNDGMVNLYLRATVLKRKVTNLEHILLDESGQFSHTDWTTEVWFPTGASNFLFFATTFRPDVVHAQPPINGKNLLAVKQT